MNRGLGCLELTTGHQRLGYLAQFLGGDDAQIENGSATLSDPCAELKRRVLFIEEIDRLRHEEILSLRL